MRSPRDFTAPEDQEPAARINLPASISPSLVTAARKAAPSLRQPVISVFQAILTPRASQSFCNAAINLLGDRWQSFGKYTPPLTLMVMDGSSAATPCASST